MPDAAAEYVEFEFPGLVPDALVPCQYQVSPADGVPLLITAVPLLLCNAGVPGVAGNGFTVKPTDELPALQQPVVLFCDRRY